MKKYRVEEFDGCLLDIFGRTAEGEYVVLTADDVDSILTDYEAKCATLEKIQELVDREVSK